MNNKKPKQQPRKSTPEPDWEDESTTVLPKNRQNQDELDAKIFREAIESANFEPKKIEDSKSHMSTRAKPKHDTSGRYEIDLHGMTLAQAENHVIASINRLLDQHKGHALELRIITGKGNHSKGRPQLVTSIHHIVESTFRHRIISIEVSPHELQLSGYYLKGHFDLKIK